MYHYRKTTDIERGLSGRRYQVSRLTCNKCGMTEDRGDKYQFDEPYTTIDNVYGYGSGKDGDRYVSHICESCMQEFYASFKIPPQVVEIVVWGETPPDPIVLDPAQEPDS